MTQGILSFYSENVWSKQHTRKTHRTLHWVLQGLGSASAMTGMTLEFINKWKSSSPHFSSTHSILGLTAFIVTLLGILNGTSALWSVELRAYVKPVYVKMAHNIIGISAFVLGKQFLSQINSLKFYVIKQFEF